MTKDFNTLTIGSVLHSKIYNYIIEEVLGQGTFGITYLAKVQMLGPLGQLDSYIHVTIKEFFMKEINGREGTNVTSSSSNKGGLFYEYKEKFAREAKNLSKLKHPNIVNVMDFFEANNTCYYVMEFLNGGDLDTLIEIRDGLSEEETLFYTRQIGSALSFMHTNKMLHLDLKPKNVMLNKNGDAILIDFGLSKQYNNNGEPESSTTVGRGTPGYAPLEQSNYQDGHGFPVTMDVYALGATMYKMLTSTRAPEASVILNEGFPDNILQSRGTSKTTLDIVKKAMSPIKKDRFQSVEELINEFSCCKRPDISIDRLSFSITNDEKSVEIDQNKGSNTNNQNNIDDTTILNYDKDEITNLNNNKPNHNWNFKKTWILILILIAGSFVCYYYIKYMFFTPIDVSETNVVYNDNISITSHNYLSTDSVSFFVDSITHPSIPKDYVFVPAGTLKEYITDYDFNTEKYNYLDIDLDSYYICNHEVTQEEYIKVMQNNPSSIKGDSLPVNCISYKEAISYCNNKSINEGYSGFYTINGDSVIINHNGNGYRLPTQYEWAYASRSKDGSKTKYAGGNELSKIAWYGGNSRKTIHQVATKSPNDRGIYDLCGNVEEYVWDEMNRNNCILGRSFYSYIGFEEMNVFGCSSPTDKIGMRIVLIPRTSTNNNTHSLSTLKMYNY